jgi:hypothetical protein
MWTSFWKIWGIPIQEKVTKETSWPKAGLAPWIGGAIDVKSKPRQMTRCRGWTVGSTHPTAQI